MKCLEKDPNRRYATAQELGDDLHRFLNAEPVTAPLVDRTPTVLVVDDSPLDLRFSQRCVEAEGCRVIPASSGRDALAIIDRDRPDAVLADLQMPEIDGLELIRRIKDSWPTIPVIIMTAHGSEEVAVQALRTGAASYIPKKNLQRDLSWALRNILTIVGVWPPNHDT